MAGKTETRPDDAMRPGEVARALGVARSTIYTIDYLRQRAFVPVGERGMRWDRRDVELYKMLRRVATPAPLVASGGRA